MIVPRIIDTGNDYNFFQRDLCVIEEIKNWKKIRKARTRIIATNVIYKKKKKLKPRLHKCKAHFFPVII